jgi:pimeloyl-ACP methyl ester carboxylesterase
MPTPSFRARWPRTVRTAALLTALAATAVADSAVVRWDCPPPAAVAPAPERGRLLILPGVGNTRFHLAGFVAAVERQLPGFDVEVRTWGVPFLTIHNLRAHERNVATARGIAAEIAAWRRQHPREPFYLVGYSGGGGMATLVTAALPDDVAIERLVLVAPAISPDYPLGADVLPHVGEFVVNYWSERDLQVGWGTRTFGTIDRKQTDSAGAIGFAARDPRLLEYRWSEADERYGHFGNHLSYLGQRWQAAKLLPALEPATTAASLEARWALTCKES